MKLFNDLLKCPSNGKYSRKSVYALVTLLVAIIIAILGLYRIGVDRDLVNDLVIAFLTVFLTLMGFTIWNKKIDKDEPNN